MSSLDLWPTIQDNDFWLIDGQHSVETSKIIQFMTEWDDSSHQNEKLKV
jgi:hypothetical protein